MVVMMCNVSVVGGEGIGEGMGSVYVGLEEGKIRVKWN